MISLAGFINFVRNQVQITPAQMPDSDPDFNMAYNAAVEWVNTDILHAMPATYDIAVYNLATSFLVNWGGAEVLQQYRKTQKLNDFTAGVIQSSSDESTSQSRLVPDFFAGLSLADLQMLKDPWGRAYLMIAAQFGSLWGLT